MNFSLIADPSELPKKVRLVTDETNEVIDRFAAFNRAQEQELDLVLISDGDVPVVKILNFGKHKYEQQKKEKHIKKQIREQNRGTKEFIFGVGISDHDLEFKVKQIKELRSKYDVQLIVKNNSQNRLKYGRHKTFSRIVHETDFVLNKILTSLGMQPEIKAYTITDNVISITLKRQE